MKIKLLIDRLENKRGDIIELPNEKALAFIQSGRGVAVIEKAENTNKVSKLKETRSFLDKINPFKADK